jgi:hypothetical protein
MRRLRIARSFPRQESNNCAPGTVSIMVVGRVARYQWSPWPTHPRIFSRESTGIHLAVAVLASNLDVTSCLYRVRGSSYAGSLPHNRPTFPAHSTRLDLSRSEPRLSPLVESPRPARRIISSSILLTSMLDLVYRFRASGPSSA